MTTGFLRALFCAAAAGACGGGGAPTAPVPVPTPVPTPAPIARYEVVFEAGWHETTHAVPPNPHFSRLIGGTHGDRVRFWEEGGIASEGMKRMAEIGAQAPLDEEVLAAVVAGTAEHLIAGREQPENPGVTRMEIEVSRAFPLVTLVTMIAPSPDWFVGVSGLALFAAGDWVAEAEVPLVPWDAGTDSGATFVAADRPTRPRQPIARIVTPPLAEGGVARPLGRFVFRRLS
jgi:hypothetical protein